MRKLTIAAIVLVLFVSSSPIAFAAEQNLMIDDALAKPGETVQLLVSLDAAVSGDTIGVSYSYDEELLEPIPDACSWSKKGVLQDFSKSNANGVWATSKAIPLSGDICVLVFRLRDNAAFTETEVSCAVLIKNGAAEVGTFQTTAKVMASCEHTFGEWKPNGNVGHTQVCGLCGKNQTQSHSWDSGTIADDSNNPGMCLLTSICTVCGGSKVEKVSADTKVNTPTHALVSKPEDTVENGMEDKENALEVFTTPVPEPTIDNDRKLSSGQDMQESGNPIQNGNSILYQPRDYNEEKTLNDGYIYEDRSYSHPEGMNDKETIPIAIKIENWSDDMEEGIATEHNHADEPEENSTAASLLAAILIASLMAVGALAFLKKKKR